MGIGLLAFASVIAACGGSPNAPSAQGVAITGLQVQISNASNGAHDYAVSYTVHNDGPADATVIGIDAALSAKGAQVQSFSIGFPGGHAVPAKQFIAATTTTFTTPAGVAIADSLTLTVHYTAGGAEQTVSRTAPLN
jgi:hypothetical protein